MSTRGIYRWKAVVATRRVGVVALLLLLHAVAIDTTHRHQGADLSGSRAAAAMGAPAHHGGNAADGPDGCPACQLQQSSVADVVRTTAPIEVATTSQRSGLERAAAVLRAGDTSPPDRAPPVL